MANPNHIINLARAVLAGERVEQILADALEEENCNECARHFRDEDLHDTDPGCCFLAEAIVNMEPHHASVKAQISELKNMFEKYKN